MVGIKPQILAFSLAGIESFSNTSWYYRLSIYHGYIDTIVYTQHNNYNDKFFIRFALTNNTPYLTLMCKL